MSRILVVADQLRAAWLLERGLRAAGFVPTLVRDGTSAYEQATSGAYELLLMDVGPPLMDGIAVRRRLRDSGCTIPVIMLMPRGSDDVGASSADAVESLAKPFRFDELVARIQLRLRPMDRAPRVSVLQFDDLALDLRTGRATVAARTVALSDRESALLETFLQHPRLVLSREELLSRVWGYDFDPSSNVVDVYIGYLRRKLGPGRIQTVRGAGYRLVDRRARAAGHGPDGGSSS